MRAAVVVIVLAILAGVLWFLSGGFAPGTVAVASPASDGGGARREQGTVPAARETAQDEARRDLLPTEPSADAIPAAKPARRLQVRVRNAAGEPVGAVPVRADLGALTAGRTEVRPTGADGVVTFPLPPEGTANPAPIPVALELPSFENLRAEVPAATIARDEVFDLTLPPCGVIAVRLFDLDGRPTRRPVRLSLRPLAPTETLADAERRAGVEVDAQAGAAEFAFVPLHSAFALIAHAHGLRARFAPLRLLGPTSQDQRVEASLREDATAACVVVRIVDTARAPVREAQIDIGLHETVQVGESSGTTTTGTIESTDSEGELRLWFDAGGTEECVRRVTFAQRAHPEASGILTLEHALPAGITHKGDVVLAVQRTVALAGHVVDEHDAPVPAARLDVSRISRFAGGGQASTGVDVDVDSNDDGAFEIRFAAAPDAEFAVSADKEGYLADGAVEARFGATDLRLRLRRAGSITGSLAIALEDRELVRVRARIADDRHPRQGRVDATTGAFALESLAAGTYAVELTMRGVGRPWLTVPDVLVRAGEATADPRLQALTLPADLRRVRVLVQDSAGRALADAVVRADEPTDVTNGIRLRQHGSDGVTMLARPGTTLVAGAPGFRSQAFTILDDTHTVRLLPGIPLRVRVVGDYAGAHPDLRLGVSATPAGAAQISYFLSSESRRTSGSARGLDAILVGGGEIPPRAGSAVLLLPTAGRWTIGLQAIAATGGMRIATRIEGDSTQDVTVGETGGEVTLNLTAQAVRAALPK